MTAARPVMRVALTGGIGSGKSAVAEVWRARGATIVDADVVAREVVGPGTVGLSAVAAAWPAVVRDGLLDRAALATIVFADDHARAALNAIVHPLVREQSAALEAAAAPGAVVVHVIPLLFEGELWRSFPTTVLVVAPDEARIARVVERDGIVREAVEARMRAQIEPAVARSRATYVIENDGERAALGARANAVYDELLALRAKP
jgi:dephospho-CoA kinase